MFESLNIYSLVLLPYEMREQSVRSCKKVSIETKQISVSMKKILPSCKATRYFQRSIDQP